MSTVLGVYSYDCSNSMFMKLSDSCIRIKNEDRSCRTRLSIYDPHKPQITYLYKSRDFNFNKSNSGTNDLYSCTSNNINAINKSLGQNHTTRGKRYDYDKQKNIFNISQMSRSNLHKNISRDPSNKAKEPVIIINQISNIDVSSVVNELLVDQDFNKVSSLFVVITSDDEVAPADSSSRFTSTKCMQLSEYQNPWNKRTQQYWPRDQTSNLTYNLAMSLKGKQYFLAELPTSIPYFKKVDTRVRQNNFTPKHIKSKNKLCQITTPCEMIPKDMQELLQAENNFVTIDTTLDRPCCCKTNHKPYNYFEYNGYVNSSASTVVSQMLIASNRLPEDLTAGATEHVIRQAQKNQALYLPDNQISGPMSTCQINQCCVQKCCASQNVPVQDPKHSNRVKFQTSVERSCKCIQEKTKEVFDQMQAVKLLNMTSTACRENSNFNATCVPTRFKHTPGQDFYRRSNRNEHIKSNTKKTVTIKPFVSTRDYQSNTLRPKFGTKYNSYSVGCQSAFKDNYVVIGPSGRAISVLGQIIPPFPGSSRRPVNTAVQNNLGCLKYSSQSPSLKQKVKCFKEPSIPDDICLTSHFKREVGLIEVMGPSGGYAAIGSGGTWTQAGHKELRVSTAIGPGNAPTQEVNMDINDKENADQINVVVTDEKGNTNVANDVKIDVTDNQSDVTNKKTKANAGNMTLVEKIISLIKGDVNDPGDTLNNKLNTLFGILNMSRIKKKIKSNDESVQTEKNKRKTKCACPQDIESMADFPDEEEKEDDNSYIDPKLLLQLRSEMCETTSGFIINKRGKMNQPAVELDVTLEDAIRYYAALHPEVLSDLIPDIEGPTNKKSCSCDRDTCCECPLDSMLKPTHHNDNPPLFELEGDEIDQPTVPFQGLRLKIPGRGATRY